MKINNNKKNAFTISLGILLALSLMLNITAFKKISKSNIPNAITCGDPCKTNYNGLPFLTVKNMIYEYGSNQSKDINSAMLTRVRNARGAVLGSPTVPISAPLNYNDARSVYFEMDTIKQFLCTIENIMMANALTKSNGEKIQKCDLGIKFYYAAYKNINLFGKGPIKQSWLDSYAGKHTLVLVATYRDSDNSIKTFDPYYFKPMGNNNIPNTMAEIKQMGNVQLHVLAVGSSAGGEGIIARNHGELCPPGNCLTNDPLLP